MRLRQFKIRHLLILIAVCACAIVAWLNFIFVHPAHRIPLYEKAPYSRSGRMTIDGTSISIDRVTRNDRDGSLIVEDGFGRPITAEIANASVLGDCGAWLDAAQIELASASGEFEVLEIRIFDSETRQAVGHANSASGQRMIDPRTLQIYRLGERLPEIVDVFLRLHVHGDDDATWTIKPEVGGKCSLGPGRDLAVKELVRGMTSFSSADGFVTDPDEEQSNFAIVLQFQGDWSSNQDARETYQLVTVMKDGIRIHDDRFFRCGTSVADADGPWELRTVSANLDDVDHFEIRPFGGRHRFFFEGVSTAEGIDDEVPATTKRKNHVGREQELIRTHGIRSTQGFGHIATGQGNRHNISKRTAKSVHAGS